MPGGIGLFKLFPDGKRALVGGIGVFFPGPDGFATYEQGFEHYLTRGTRGPQRND